MTIHEEALRWIDRQVIEQQAIISKARQAIRDLEKEKLQILAMAARDGIDPIQLRDV